MEKSLLPYKAYLKHYQKQKFAVTSIVPSDLQFQSIATEEFSREFSRVITDAIRNQIATVALHNSIITKNEDYNNLRTSYTARGYCFDEQNILNLIKEVYESGYYSGLNDKSEEPHVSI